MTIYNFDNCDKRTLVYDVDTKERMALVLSINTERMTLMVHDTMKWDDGQVEIKVIRYTTIYPIFGDSLVPVLFHCYGSKQ